jgi:hypothetical protein
MDTNWNWGAFAKYLIWRNIRYSAVRIASDMSRSNFQQRYILVAPLHDKRMTRRFPKIYTAIGTAL